MPLDVTPVVSDDPEPISGIQSDFIVVSIHETTTPTESVTVSEQESVSEPALEPAIDSANPALDSALEPEPSPCHSGLDPESPARTFSLALKTNLLFDILATPNIEVEFPFARDRFSVMGEFWFPWWVDRKDSWCYELLYGGLEARWWFQNRTGREALTGHFVGLYAGGGLYDLEWKSKGYQGEFLVAAGISYGYSFRLNKSLRLETSLGVGYMKTDYRHYLGMEDNNFLVWQYDGIFSWFGPTKAKVSLVWLLGGKKGGMR